MQTRTCGPAINILNIPITEPSVPFLINSDNIANGNAKILAQPIPAIPIQIPINTGFVDFAIPTNAITKVINEIACTLLFPYFVDNKPIGIETTKQTKFWIAKQIDEKFVALFIVFK